MIIKIYYPSFLNNIPLNTYISIKLFPQSIINKNYIEKYYKCVYEINYEYFFDLSNEKNIMNYLEELLSLFNSKNNPLSSKENQDKIKSLKSHINMTVGDIIQINDLFYIVTDKEFYKILN